MNRLIQNKLLVYITVMPTETYLRICVESNTNKKLRSLPAHLEWPKKIHKRTKLSTIDYKDCAIPFLGNSYLKYIC